MAKSALQNPAFHDDNAAREALEAIRWPDGPVCPHCGNLDREKIAKGQRRAHRPGLYYCAACNGQFTVTVGTVMERSKIPLSKWLLAMHLMGASKKGMSALQLQRMLGVTYKSAWFLCHRIREAMRDDASNPCSLGGQNKAVEADETYVGGKAKNRAHCKPAPKKAVLSLVEREGHVRSFHVADVTSKTVGSIIEKNVSAASALMTDESVIYPKIGAKFANHLSVNHSAGEYVRLGSYVHINTAENFYSILKRGITGVYHSVSEAHLHRYLAEFDFRYNNRIGLGVDDGERAVRIAKGIAGKRLTYRPINRDKNARSIH
ncbi:MAG: IS1595 family transposase [Hyphomicrobiales bacterium]|nr:IS1595 family transposase [Hyphomicrobiales bacterium]